MSFPPTIAGNLNVIVANPGHYTTVSGLSATDSQGQTYALDGSCGTPSGDGYVCVFFVCSGVGGVTSAIVSGIDGIAAINFIEASGILSSNCAGAISTAAGVVAPCQIKVTPDQPNELAIVGFATAGPASSVNGNVTYSNQLDFGADPVATVTTTSTEPLWAETDSGSSGCVNTDNENPNGYNATFATFRTQLPSTITCPSSAPVPSIAGCSYSSDLGSLGIGSTSPVQSVNATIAAGTDIGQVEIVAAGATNKDFVGATGSSCTTGMYAETTNCVLNVIFSPQAAGLRTGSVALSDTSGNILAAIPLSGIGTGPQVAYASGNAPTTVGSGYSTPRGVSVDSQGNVFVADATSVLIDSPSPSVYSGTIDKIAAGGAKSTVGTPFAFPIAVAVDGAGALYVADANAASIGVIPMVGTQTTVGSGFSSPSGVSVDGAGNVYVADAGAAAVFKITPGGEQSQVGSGWSEPAGLTLDSAGDLFVADAGLTTVSKITPDGTQTVAGTDFSIPKGVAVDAAGSLYVIDAGSGNLYEVTPAGVISTVASGFQNPSGVAIDATGNLYVADTGHAQVVKIDRADTPSLSFATTSVGATSTDSPKTVALENIGNEALTLTYLNYPVDFPEATGYSKACTSTSSLSSGEQCDLTIDFTPLSSGGLSEAVTLTDNALDLSRAQQSIGVSGTAGSGLISQTITFALASPVAYGVSPIRLSATGGGSGNAVVFSVLSGPGSVSGNTLTVTGAGTIVVAANQAGNANYAAAPQVTRTLVVNRAEQNISFTPPTGPFVFGGKPISISAKSSSGLPVAFRIQSGPASIRGDLLTTTGAGSITVVANQAGNANYSPAQPVDRIMVVNKAPQTITFPAPKTPIVYGIVPFALTARASSGLAVSFTVIKGPAKIKGRIVTIVGSGVVETGARQAGNADYEPASERTRLISITKAKLTVKAVDLTMKRGTKVPPLQFRMSGFVDGDTRQSAVTGKPDLSTDARPTSKAGNYPIVITEGTLSARSYSFHFINGVLKIIP